MGDKSKIELDSCGTFGYIAPEIVKARIFSVSEYSKREIITTLVDVYSLGIVFYKLLTGESPWRNTTDLNWHTVLKIDFSEKNFKLRHANANFIELLERMLTKSPEDRISANSLLAELEEIETNFTINTKRKARSRIFKIAESNKIAGLNKISDKEMKNSDLCTQAFIIKNGPIHRKISRNIN